MMNLLLFGPLMMIAGCWLSWRVYRSLTAGAALLTAGMMLTAITVEPLDLTLVGFHVYMEDLVALTLTGAAMLRLLKSRTSARRLRVWFGFLAAMSLALVLGAAWNGLKAAGVESRAYFYFLAPLVYVASFQVTGDNLKRLARVWMAGCAALMALALFRWMAVMLNLSIVGSWAIVGAGHPMRVLNASHALFLAEGLLILYYYSRQHTVVLLKLALCALGLSVVLLQHRSVWVALLVSAGVICYRERKFRPLLVGVAVAGILTVVVFVAAPDDLLAENAVAQSLAASIEEPFDLEVSTFGWRLLMWQQYVLEFVNLSPAGKLTGVGLGNPTAYVIDNSESDASAHNIYIFILNRAGVLGLSTFLFAYGALWKRLRVPKQIRLVVSWTPLSLLFAILVGQLTYFMVYGPAAEQGLLVGAMTAVPSLWCRFTPELEAPPTAVEEVVEEVAVT